jgi:hypothetical protein
MKIDSVETDSIADGACTNDKIADNAITSSKIGQLNGLTVNGIVNATSFVATSGAGESGSDGFALPLCKTLSIEFTDAQVMPNDGQFHTVGGDSTLSATTFTFDDNISIVLATSVARLKHSGIDQFNGPIEFLYEVAYYNSSGIMQPYANVHTQKATKERLWATAVSLAHRATLGNGASRIAAVRFRIKHSNQSESLSLIDNYQQTCLAIKDDSANSQRTFASGVIS